MTATETSSSTNTQTEHPATGTYGRARGRFNVARSLWYTGPKQAELRTERVTMGSPGVLTIQTHFSAISRGTERLVWSGSVPSSEWQRMRAPMQSGEFPFPIKYGYSAAGIVIDGPDDMIGAHTFSLHPHQDIFVTPLERVMRIPQHLPLRRATLAANMETALNGVWDSGAGPGDKIVIVGAGVVGLLIAFVTAGMPAADVTVVDIDPSKRSLAEKFGARFVPVDDATDATIGDTADVVFHTSANPAGLNQAIRACGFEATLVEMSWYGDQEVGAALGGSFHAKRLALVSSQVGHVAARRRARWSHTRRLETAVRLLEDDRLDALVGSSIAFDDLPGALENIFDGSPGHLVPIVKYPAAA